MKDHQQQVIKSRANSRDSSVEKINPRFVSITRTFLSSKASQKTSCPNCGATLNFTEGIEWIGPDSFTCGACQHLINIRLIQRALRDLGVE